MPSNNMPSNNMSNTHAEDKIQDALAEAKGNTTQAQKILIGWALRDHELLLALVKPHITGITAHAINRVAQEKTKPESVSGSGLTQKSMATDNMAGDNKMSSEKGDKLKSKKKSLKDSIGMDILKTIAAGETAQFGQENYGRPLGKKGASQRHIDAIHQIIKSGEAKK